MITVYKDFKEPTFQGFTTEEWSALATALAEAIRDARARFGEKAPYTKFLMQLHGKVSRNESTAVFLTREALKEWREKREGETECATECPTKAAKTR